MGRDTIAELIAGIIQRNSINSEMIQQNRRPKQAFVDSETETEFTEVALSPKVEENNSNSSSSSRPSSRRQQALFQKRNRSPGGGASNNGSNQFHSLPHNSINKTSSNFGQVSSWEANNLMEEMTTHNSHKFISTNTVEEAPTTPTVRSTASNNSTLELDSLSARYPIVHEEDSLNFDLQEIDEEDSLTPDEHFYEHDSLQPVVKPIVIQDNSSKGGLLKGGGQQNQDQPKKLKVIPYNESFSSTTSIFTTSQDGSLDSCNKNVDEQTEEDSLTQSNPNLTLNMVPIKSWPAAHTVVSVSATSHPINHHPKIIGPEYQQPIQDSHRILYQQQQMIQQQVPQPPATIVKPVINLAQPTSAQAVTMVVPQSNQSLVKMATERMKRKFLGWS